MATEIYKEVIKNLTKDYQEIRKDLGENLKGLTFHNYLENYFKFLEFDNFSEDEDEDVSETSIDEDSE